MQIYKLLKSDHKNIKKLLRQLDDVSEKYPALRTKLLKAFKEALIPHARAEEQVLYDRLKKSEVEDADVLAFEGYEEHAVVDRLMEELEYTSPSDKRWTALLSVIKENLEHHIEDEEDGMFKKAQKSFDREVVAEMAEDFLTLKAAFLKQVKAGKTVEQVPSREPAKAA